MILFYEKYFYMAKSETTISNVFFVKAQNNREGKFANVFILESRTADTIGKTILFELSSKYGNSTMRRVAWNDMGSFIESFPNALPPKFPAVVILRQSGYVRSPW